MFGKCSGERSGEQQANVREKFGDPVPSPYKDTHSLNVYVDVTVD